jgi:hypothetical protein
MADNGQIANETSRRRDEAAMGAEAGSQPGSGNPKQSDVPGTHFIQGNVEISAKRKPGRPPGSKNRKPSVPTNASDLARYENTLVDRDVSVDHGTVGRDVEEAGNAGKYSYQS